MLAVIFFGGAGGVRGTWRHLLGWWDLGWWVRVKSEAFEGQASSADFNSALPLKISLGSFPFFDFISAIK